jgi:hypothetical protein
MWGALKLARAVAKLPSLKRLIMQLNKHSTTLQNVRPPRGDIAKENISSSRSLTTDRVCNREDCLNPRCCNEDEEGKRVKEDPARTGLASYNCCSCNKGDNNCLPHAIAIAAAPPQTLLLSKFDQNFLSSSQRWLANGSK